MKVCSKCNAKFEDGKFCSNCGGELTDEITDLHCTNCGALLSQNVKFCSNCGNAIGQNVSNVLVPSSFIENDAEPCSDEWFEKIDTDNLEKYGIYTLVISSLYSEDGNQEDYDQILEERGIKAIEEEAKKRNDADIFYYIALCYEGNKFSNVGRNEKKMFRAYKKSADLGDSVAMFIVANLYSDGVGTNENDNLAFAYMRKSADLGYSEAENIMGLFYMTGNFVEENQEYAVSYFKSAAEKGSISAKFNLGKSYYYGDGVDSDYEYGLTLIQEAANEGHEDAIEWLNDDDHSDDNVAGGFAKGIGSFIGGVLGGAAVGFLNGLTGNNDDDDDDYDDDDDAQSDSNCFITTATCQSRNLPDDCHELMTLRKFRDTFMQSNYEMKKEVLEYYEIAPKICKKIDEQENSKDIYESIWDNYLKTAVFAVDNGNLEDAHKIYKKMVLNLKEKFLNKF